MGQIKKIKALYHVDQEKMLLLFLKYMRTPQFPSEIFLTCSNPSPFEGEGFGLVLTKIEPTTPFQFRRPCNNTSVKLPILNSFFLLFFWRSRPSRHNMLVLKWSKQHFEESIFRQITLVFDTQWGYFFVQTRQLFIAVSNLKVNLSSLICQKKGIHFLDQIKSGL